MVLVPSIVGVVPSMVGLVPRVLGFALWGFPSFVLERGRRQPVRPKEKNTTSVCCGWQVGGRGLHLTPSDVGKDPEETKGFQEA